MSGRKQLERLIDDVMWGRHSAGTARQVLDAIAEHYRDFSHINVETWEGETKSLRYTSRYEAWLAGILVEDDPR